MLSKLVFFLLLNRFYDVSLEASRARMLITHIANQKACAKFNWLTYLIYFRVAYSVILFSFLCPPSARLTFPFTTRKSCAIPAD